MRFRVIKNSLLGGQISRTAVGRTDLPQYPHSCELLQNMIPMLSGGAYRRPGTLAIAIIGAQPATAPLSSSYPPRLFPFIVSRSEAYCLQYVYNPSEGGTIAFFRVEASAFSGISSGLIPAAYPYINNPGTTNTIGNNDDDIWAVQYAQSKDVLFLTHPNYKPWVIKRTTLDTFTGSAFDAGLTGLALAQAYPYLNQNATPTTMKVSTGVAGNSDTLTCSTPYFSSQHVGSIFAIQVGTSSSADLGFIQITSVTDNTHAVGTILVGVSSTLAQTTWWESAWSTYRGWPRSVCLFQQRLCMGGTVPASGNAVDTLGVSTGQPDSIWFSEIGAPFKFSALGDSAIAGTKGTLANGQQYTTPGPFVYYPVDDSQGDGQSTGPIGQQPFRITLADSQLDSIQWMSPDQQLLLGTLMEEWIIAPVNGQFDAGNSVATIQSHYGSDFVPAVRIGYELMFVLRQQQEMRAYQYNYFDQSFFGEPVQLFFDEYPMAEQGTLTNGRRKVRQMAWDGSRSTLWCLDTAGNLFGMTRDRKLQVTMWHTHQMGGFNAAQGIQSSSSTYADPAWQVCDGSVISFVCVPNPYTGMDDVFMVVKRTVNSLTTWCLERMVGGNTIRQSAYSPISPNTQNSEPAQVDFAFVLPPSQESSSTYTYSANAIPRIAFYTGYTLTGTYYSKAWGLFAIGTNQVAVVDGDPSLTISQPLPPDYGTADVHAMVFGLPYTSIVQPVRVDSQGQIGTTQGAIKRISKAYLRLYKTLMLKCGYPPGSTVSAPAVVPWTPPQSMAQSPEIFTGDKQVFVNGQYDRDGYLYVAQDQPLPFTLVCIISEGQEYEQ